MAESIISPGVFTRENDLSFIQPAPVAVGAAFIGPTVKGPVEMPTVVTSYNDYVRKFGVTFASGSDKFEYLTSLAVKNYFSQGGNTALITRVVDQIGTQYSEAQSTNIASNKLVGTNRATGSGTLAAVAVDGQKYIISASGVSYTFVASDGPIPTDQPGSNVYYFATGSNATDTAANLRDQINSASAYLPVSASSNGAILALSGSVAGTSRNGIQFLTGSAIGGTPDSLLFTIAGGTDAAPTSFPFSINTIGKGAIYNNSTAASDAGAQNSDGSLISGSEDNLRWEITNVSNARGTFTLSVRRGDDSTNTKVILETFNNLSLDPASDDYIEKRIGNQYTQVGSDGNSKFLQLIGDYPNRSNYIRVSDVHLPTLNYLGNDGVSVNLDAAGVSYSASLPQAVSGAFHSAGGTIIGGANFFKDINGTNTQGLVATDYTVNAIPLLENKDDYQFNVVIAPGVTAQDHPTVVDALISLAENRGDCIAVVDLVGYNEPSISQVVTEAAVLNSSYAATYWPWLQTRSATGKNEWIPASTVIPGVYTFTDAAAAPWFAPAGLVRGGIPGIIQAQRRLTKGERDTLYSGKVNPIASFPGTGISVFGQKTLQTKASALDRVNVRRLLIELKKFIGDQAKNLVFEQNTIATRNKFLATVNPYLESVVQRQGLYAYRVVMDESNNSADVVDRNQLIGQIYIQPAKTIEFVVLDFTIEPTGATFV
jgi:hypothetical protein